MNQKDWLSDILHNVQLEQFYVPIRDQLQVTRLAHFDYVHSDDLEKIGISKPGIRRLLETVKKKKLQQWRRNLWNKLLGSSSSTARDTLTTAAHKTVSGESGLTCLILEKNITLQEELGTGSFGVVKKGEWKSTGAVSNSLPVAVKVLKADALSQPGVFDDFVHEVEAMHCLNHPNLIRLHGVVFHPLMMVCELATMGALLDYIRAQNGKVSLNLIWKWSEQVAGGMAYLEKNRFLHRDLACRNILLSSLDMVKIGDFGLMRALPDSDDCYVMSERRRVPFPWCAPESLRSKQFSHASDVWMFAVALWEMYTFGEDPWMGLNGSEILRLILREGQRLTAPIACPPDVYMLMMQCWDLNPKERPTFTEIVKYLDMNKLESALSSLSYRKQGQMTIDSGDSIILIDKRPELHWWKGQNQRTLEVGLFPCTLVNVLRNKNSLATRKSQTMSPSRKEISELSAATQRDEASDDGYERSGVVLRRKKTLESRQAASTRAGNPGNKHFNYSKLVNQRAADTPRPLTVSRVKEDLLIDLDLPPSTLSSPAASSPSVQRNISLMDEPIDVPQAQYKQEDDTNIASHGSTSATQQASYSNLQAARSLDSLVLFNSCSPRPSNSTCDPFDTSHAWPASPPPVRPNYEFTSNIKQPDSTPTHRPRPSYNLSTTITPPNNIQSLSPQLNNQRVNYQTCTDTPTEIYTRTRPNYEITPLGVNQSTEQRIYGNLDRNTSPHYAPNTSNNLIHTSLNSSLGTSQFNSTIQNDFNGPTQSEHIYTNNTIPVDQTCETNSIRLTELSLDDKISESLNLKMKPTSMYSDNIHSNDTALRHASMKEKKRHSVAENSRSSGIYSNNSMSTYPNYEASLQQAFVTETRDYYTKLSTPSSNCTNDYHKNIYVPTNEDTGKLKDFSGGIYNTKNYSSVNTKNLSSEYEYTYASPYGTGEASTSQAVPYDPVYSEITGPVEPTYNNVRLYDEVYEPSGRSRPHRPAPPAPIAPSASSPRPN